MAIGNPTPPFTLPAQMGVLSTPTLLGLVFLKPPTFPTGTLSGPLSGVVFLKPPKFVAGGAVYAQLDFIGWGTPIGIT